MEKKPNVGGQAVIEGVMMRGKDKIAVAVRQPDGEIAIDVGPANSITDKYPFLKKPLLRGVVALCESLYHGMRRWLIRHRFPVKTTNNLIVRKWL